MKNQPFTPACSDEQRLTALREYGILDTADERTFDDIVRLVALICQTPVAVINFIDKDRQWFKSEVGLGVRETPVDVSLCAHAILEPDLLVVPDTEQDDRFRNNPLVTGEPHLRFYAGAQLRTPNGHALGTLCVLDYRPRNLTGEQRDALQSLARQVMALLELRRASAEQARSSEGRRQADQRLARDAQLLANVRDSVIVTDLSGIITLWNEGATRLFGWTAEEMVGRPYADRLPEPSRSEVSRWIAKIAAGGAGFEGEWLDVRKDGSPVWIEASTRLVTDTIGTPIHIMGVSRDVSQRKRVETELRQSQERLSFSVEAADLGTFYCPMPLGEIVWNDKCKEHFWLPPDAKVDFDRFYSILHPDDREPTRRAVEQAVFDHQPYDIQYRTVAPDGRTRWVRAKGRAYYDASGTPNRFDGVTIDVSEQKRVEQEVRASEERYRGVLVALEEGITVHDARGAIVMANASAERLLGLTLDQMRGIDSFDPRWYACSEDGSPLPGEQHPPQIALRTGRPVVNMVMGISHAGSPLLWVSANAVVLQDPHSGDITGAVSSFFDISERKRIEADRERLHQSEREARAEAERASRMKDEFLATLSHELRTPLNAILGWSQIIKRSSKPADMAQGIDVIERNARTQAQLIEDLLDMSRIISGKVRLDVQRLDLAVVVQAAVETARPTAEAKSIKLKSVIDPLNGVAVSGDPNRLQQVLWNLLTNAIKFTPKGGSVQVVLERVNSHLEISVIDTGEGIKPEFLPYVFDRFRQADASITRRHGGLGLGLSIVKQLAELHGGSIRVTSLGEGHGSTFIVSLPLTVTQPEARQEANRRHPRVGGDAPRLQTDVGADIAGVKVLVVDDEPDARALVKRLLEDCNAVVSTASSAAEALEKLRAERPDVLLSDVGMPTSDGYQFIRQVRALHEDQGGKTPALALTAYARAEDRMQAIRAGFQMHVPKPVEPAELITMVASLAGRGRD